MIKLHSALSHSKQQDRLKGETTLSVQWKLISTLILSINKSELAHRISGSPPQNLMFEPAFNPEMRCLLFSESVICM